MSATEQATRDVVKRYTEAIRLRPGEAGDLYSDLGSQLSAFGQRRAAAASYAHAIALVPTHAVAYNNLAALVAGSSRRSEALHLYVTAHRLKPEHYARFPQMHLNLAGALVDAGRYDEAIWHYDRGLAYVPHEADTLSRLLHLSQRVCDWRAVDRLWHRARHALVTRALRSSHRRSTGSRPVLSPMHALTLPLSADDLFGLSIAHAAAIEAEAAAGRLGRHHPKVPAPLGYSGGRAALATEADAGRQARSPSSPTSHSSHSSSGVRGALRVGWISADFKRHPVTILLAPALALMRATCTDLHLSLFPLNSLVPIAAEAADPWAERASAATHEVAPLSNLSDEHAVARVHESGPHILVDLHGLYSRSARPRILAARPAAVQATHLGYGASTGARFLDYVFADRLALPATRAHADIYTERFVLLPRSHLPAGHAQLYARLVPTHQSNGGGGGGGGAAGAGGDGGSGSGRGSGRGSGSGSGRGSGSGSGSGSGGGSGPVCCPECDASSSSAAAAAASRERCPSECRERERRRYGLPPASGASAGVVFAYLGQHLKVDQATYDRWLALLHATPRSVLWLLRWPSSPRALVREAAARGIHPRRIRFAEREPQGDHLCAFSLADVALDSPVYSSGATGIDVLWSGVPMLAMPGGMRAGRDAAGGALGGAAGGGLPAGSGSSTTAAVSTIFQRNAVSLLDATALPEAVGHTSAGYVQLGMALGRRLVGA